MTCELHPGYSDASHASTHQIYSDAVKLGLERGRTFTPKESDRAIVDVVEVMHRDPSSIEECTQMLTKLIRISHPYVAELEPLTIDQQVA